MKAMRSLHDNNIYAYSIICDERRIVLHTEYHEQTPSEYTDVIFNGVVAHYFRDQLTGNIILDLEEAPVEFIVQQHAPLFVERKKWGWPGIEYADLEQLTERLRESDIHGFVLSASYGMDGWVLAREMRIVERTVRNTHLYAP